MKSLFELQNNLPVDTALFERLQNAVSILL